MNDELSKTFSHSVCSHKNPDLNRKDEIKAFNLIFLTTVGVGLRIETSSNISSHNKMWSFNASRIVTSPKKFNQHVVSGKKYFISLFFFD